MRRLTILGVSGSIGRQTIEVIQQFPHLFELKAISVHHQIDYALALLEQFPTITHIALGTASDGAKIKTRFPHVKVVSGPFGLIEIATLKEVDMVVNALVGFAGFVPTYRAIEASKDIALANKETLVAGGEIIMTAVAQHNISLRPIDSEHSAIFQCLMGESRQSIQKLWLTASGGPFRLKSRQDLKNVTKADALKHPNWVMGSKITIDSATMVNKGLEVIEAHWLFNMPYERIGVVMHPESIVHSMVEFIDGSIKSQLGMPSMKTPIQIALGYPDRLPYVDQRLSFNQLNLHFSLPSFERFPALRLAYSAGQQGGSLPTVLNAANEIAVQAFLTDQLPFDKIETIIEETMNAHTIHPHPTIDDILKINDWARNKAQTLITKEAS